jgi:hypothetical protein
MVLKYWQTIDQNAASMRKIGNTTVIGYNNLGWCDMLFIILHILWQKFIPHKAHNFLPCLACYMCDRLSQV